MFSLSNLFPIEYLRMALGASSLHRVVSRVYLNRWVAFVLLARIGEYPEDIFVVKT